MQREGWIGVRPYRRAKEIEVAPTLTVFPAPDAEGARLAQEIVGLGTTVGYDCRIETEYSLRTGMRAQLCDDVAVYDLTTDGTIVGAYRALSALYTFFDHVLLVSRTPLPLNLLPARAGGAPPYPYPAKQLEGCIYSDHAADLAFVPSARHGQAPWAHDLTGSTSGLR